MIIEKKNYNIFKDKYKLIINHVHKLKYLLLRKKDERYLIHLFLLIYYYILIYFIKIWIINN
jgi:hypothetical protein